jgi:hypothetical protein
MTPLSVMASLLCTELGLFDDTSIALAKFFLSKNYNTTPVVTLTVTDCEAPSGVASLIIPPE